MLFLANGCNRDCTRSYADDSEALLLYAFGGISPVNERRIP